MSMNALLRKKGSLKKDAALVYSGYFLRYLSQIILIPYYGRVLGPTSYGQVMAAMSFMTIIWVVVNYGFPMPGVRDLASAKTRDERTAIFSRQLLARTLLVPFGLLIGVVGTLLSPSLAENIWFGVLGTILGFLNAFSLSWFFQGLRQFRTSILLEAIAYPITILLVLLFVRGPEDGIYAMIALVVSGAVCLTTSFFFALKYASFRLQPLRDWLKEVKNATIFFATSFSFTLLTSGSTYILSLMATATEVGYFGAAEKFVSLGVSFLGPMGQVLMPTISGLHKENVARAFQVARKGLMVETCYGLLAPLAGVVLAPFLIPLILGKGFEPSVLLFQIMLWIFPFAAFKHAVILYMLVPLRKEKYFLMTSLVNVAVNLSIALMAVPLWGATGMAYARIGGEVVATVFLAIVISKLGLLKRIVSDIHLYEETAKHGRN